MTRELAHRILDKVAHCAFRLFRRPPPPPKRPVCVRRALITLQMGIGNAVMMAPFLTALRRAFPAAHLAGVTGEMTDAGELLVATGLLDSVIRIDGRPRQYWRRVLTGLRIGIRGWDLVAVRFRKADLEVLAAMAFGRARIRVGHADAVSDSMFNVSVPVIPEQHEVDLNTSLARAIGLEIPLENPRLSITTAMQGDADRVLARMGHPVGMKRDFIAIHPGSSALQPWKRWPPEHWQELVRILCAERLPIVGLGAADERKLVQTICSRAQSSSLAGTCTLKQTAAILARAAVLICGDSSLMHIAAAVNTPVVALFGPTDLVRTRPRGNGHCVIRADICPRPTGCLDLNGVLANDCRGQECMAAIGPELVVSAVRSILLTHHEQSYVPLSC